MTVAYTPAERHAGPGSVNAHLGVKGHGPRLWSYTYLHTRMRWTDEQAARRLGVSIRTINRWKRHGIGDQLADRIAVHLNTYPSLIWPGWHWANIVLADRGGGMNYVDPPDRHGCVRILTAIAALAALTSIAAAHLGAPPAAGAWRDLSGAELRARLTQRGVPASLAARLVTRRHQPVAAQTITRYLQRRGTAA